MKLRRWCSVLLTLCMTLSLLHVTAFAGEAKETAAQTTAHEHSFEAVRTTEPTCTEPGFTLYACECGESYTADETAPLGHDWGEGAVTVEPTEEAEGERTFTCSRCGAEKTEGIEKLPAAAHEHSYEAVGTTEPTCTEPGFTVYACECGESYTADETAPLGHDWGEGLVTLEPTEEAEGERTFTCSRCGAEKTEDIEKLPAAALVKKSAQRGYAGRGEVTVSLIHRPDEDADRVVMTGSFEAYLPDGELEGPYYIYENDCFEYISAETSSCVLEYDDPDLYIGVRVTLTLNEQNVLSISEAVLEDSDYEITVNKDSSHTIQFYPVSVKYLNDYGTVTASPALASEGSTVSLTIAPQDDFVLKNLIVRDSQGQNVEQISEDWTSFVMPASAATVLAEWEPETGSEGWTPVWSWTYLQEALSAGGNITLQQNYTAGKDDPVLTVPSGVEATLDLNGYTIDRGLANSESQARGNVITNKGTLTITDTSTEKTGAITGGNNTSSGGGIINESTLTVSGGSISGNSAQEAGAVLNQARSELTITDGMFENNTAFKYGGGAIVNHGTVSISGGTVRNNSAHMNGGGIWTEGTLTITGGSISNNNAGQLGGAVYATGNAAVLNIQGNPLITNNTAANIPSNVYLSNDTLRLNVTGVLDTDARIGVTLKAGAGTVTNLFGNSGNGPGQLECFVSDSPSYLVGADNSQEVILGDPVTVSFDPGPGSGTMADVTVAKGSMYTLPECSFTPPESFQTFSCWAVNAEARMPGDILQISDDITITAAYSIYYVDRSDGSDTVVNLESTYTIVTSGTTWCVDGMWYAVTENVEIMNPIFVNGTVNLILCDGAALTARNGIRVTAGNTLNIYGQSRDSGELTAGGNSSAGIGSTSNESAAGTITIHGGTIKATGSTGRGRPGQDPVSGSGAGIGGCNGPNITIHGGKVTATGGNGAAGIGGNYAEPVGKITITGGTVTAHKNGNISDGRSIGGGACSKYDAINITGGTVTAPEGIGSDNSWASQCEILLSWTNMTDSIYAKYYIGNVTLEKDFKAKEDGTVFSSGPVSNTFDIEEKTLIPNITVTINGVSGSFNDKIKLNYYFNIPEMVLADKGASVTITNENTEKTITLPVKDAELVEGKGYKFSIPLAAKEASDIITAKVYDGQGNELTVIGNTRSIDYTRTGVQYSLMEYFTWLEENGEGSEKAVGAAARDYCSAAQIYFNYNADNVSVSSAVDEVVAAALSDYIAGREGTLPTGVSIRGISAMLESDNTLRLYFGFKNVDPSSLTFKIDGAETALRQRSDGMYYLALDGGVYSNHLHDPHTYSVSDGTNTYTITASVLTYARSCAIKDIEAESNLGKALYLYSQAAKEAFK